jgi:hypothetical protein
MSGSSEGTSKYEEGVCLVLKLEEKMICEHHTKSQCCLPNKRA